MQFLILGWLVLQLTESSSKLGLVIFLYGLPNLIVTIFGGVIADRIDRLRLLITTQGAVSALIFIVGTLTVFEVVTLRSVYIAAVILGVLQALSLPSRMAIVADLVHPREIMNAVALTMAVNNAGRIIGPAIAGGIIEVAGIGASLYFNVACYVISLVCLMLIRGRPPLRALGGTSIYRDVLDGLRYANSVPIIALIVLGTGPAMGMLAFPYMQVMPAFAKEVLEVGAGGTGLLLLAAGLGGAFGNLALASLGDLGRNKWLYLGALLAFIFTLLLLALSPWYWASWVILLFLGMASMSYISVGTAMLQIASRSDMRGRVMGLWTIGSSMMYIGSLPMGVAADTLDSWPVAIAGGALLCLVFNLWRCLWRPTLRRHQN